MKALFKITLFLHFKLKYFVRIADYFKLTLHNYIHIYIDCHTHLFFLFLFFFVNLKKNSEVER